MSPLDTNAAALSSVGERNFVAVVEDLKRAALAITAEIDFEDQEGNGQERIERLLARTSEPCEELLALAYPLIEYGDERSLEAIPRVLLHIGNRTSAARQEREPHRLGGSIVLGRLIWAMTAYAIHCSRFDAIADASRATVRVPFTDNANAPLISLTSLRYPDALGGNASRSFEDYREWLQQLPLITKRYPLFADELDAVFGEADVLLAMVAAQEGSGVYSMGLATSIVSRLARRLRDPKQRRALGAVFGVAEAALDDALEQAYARLKTDQHRWERPPTTLFGPTED